MVEMGKYSHSTKYKRTEISFHGIKQLSEDEFINLKTVQQK